MIVQSRIRAFRPTIDIDWLAVAGHFASDGGAGSRQSSGGKE
jgi:hypothetical protein